MKCSFIFLSVLLFCASPAYANDIDIQKELAPAVSETNPAEVRTYKHDDGAKITEYKSNGKVWMIKIQPAGGFPAYYLYDDVGDGTFRKRIAGNDQPKPPMWIIKRF